MITLMSAGYILLFLAISIIRLFYPYELEWIEGAMIDQMRWILSGKPLYGPPEIHFTPFAYTPIYFYLSAGLMKFIGDGFIAPRLVSILSTLGCLLVIFAVIRKLTGQQLAGLIAAGIFAATYQVTGAWMDLAKVDSLFLLLSFLGFWFCLHSSSVIAMLFGGFLFASAYFTKQSALPLLLVFLPISLWIERGRNWWIWITTALLIIVVVIASEVLSDGWFSFYVIRTVTTHPLDANPGTFWYALLPKFWPALILLPIIFLLRKDLILFPTQPAQHQTYLVFGFILALVVASWSVYLKIWTYSNNLLPASAGLALLSGLGASELFAKKDAPGRLGSLSTILRGTVLLLLLCQFILLLYNPIATLPTAVHHRKAGRIVNRLRSLPGEVLFFSHGYYNNLAGKTTYLHSVPLGDILTARFPPGSDSERRKAQTEKMFRSALSIQAFDWVISDSYPEFFLPDYVSTGSFLHTIDTTYPGREGSMIPRFLLAKNPVVHGGVFPLDDPLYDRLFIQGWIKPDDNQGRPFAERAVLALVLEAGADYQLLLDSRLACPSGEPQPAILTILWNEHPVGDLELSSCKPISAEFLIPAEQVRDKAYNDLQFQAEFQPGGMFDSGSGPAGPQLEILRLEFIRR